MKTFNLKQPFSKSIRPSQRVEIIPPTLMKAMLKFCATNKLFELKIIRFIKI